MIVTAIVVIWLLAAALAVAFFHRATSVNEEPSGSLTEDTLGSTTKGF